LAIAQWQDTMDLRIPKAGRNTNPIFDEFGDASTGRFLLVPLLRNGKDSSLQSNKKNMMISDLDRWEVSVIQSN
jgi:hypothetical protein